MTEPRLKILSPWAITAKKLAALFDGDPQIAFNVNWGSANPTVVLSCNNGDKVAALLQILPSEVKFGNITLPITVDGTPSNRAFKTKVELFDAAFKGNPAYAYSVAPGDEVWWISTTYVVFKNHVVQFFADNLNDCHGLISCLYQDLAQELLTGPATEGGVFFNTDVEQANLGRPLGEWP